MNFIDKNNTPYLYLYNSIEKLEDFEVDSCQFTVEKIKKIQSDLFYTCSMRNRDIILENLKVKLSNFLKSPNIQFFNLIKQHNTEIIEPSIPQREYDVQVSKAKLHATESVWMVAKNLDKYGIKNKALIFEIAKFTVAKSSYVVDGIENFGIKDQAHLFEIAKIAATNGGKETSRYIRNFEIHDEEFLFEIACIAVAQDAAGASEYIYNYGIESEAYRFKVAKISAAQNGEATSLDICNYNIQDKAYLFEIAKIAAAQNGKGTSAHICNYRIEDETCLFEIAKIAAAQDGEGTLSHISNYGIKDKALLDEIVKIARSQNDKVIPKIIDDLKNKDETSLFEMAKTAAAQNGEDLSFHIREYGIQDQGRLFEIAKIAAAQNGAGTSKYINNYGIKDEALLFEIAKIATQNFAFPSVINTYGFKNKFFLFEIVKLAAARNGNSTIQDMHSYGIKDNEQLFTITKIAAVNSGGSVSHFIRNSGITDPARLFEIAKIAATNDPFGTSTHIDKYGFAEEVRYEIAKMAASNSNRRSSIEYHIQNYRLKNEAWRFEIAKMGAAQDGMGTSQYINNYCFKTKEKVINIALIGLQQHFTQFSVNNEWNIPEKFCGIPITELLNNEFSLIGQKLVKKSSEPLLPNEKLLLKDILDLVDTSSQSLDNQEEIRLRTIVNQWLGFYILNYSLWINSKKGKAEISVESPLNTLTFKTKITSELLVKGKNVRLTKKELKISKRKEELDLHPLFKAISKLRNPSLRYKLTNLLFQQLFYSETLGPLEIYRQLDTGKRKSPIKQEQLLIKDGPRLGTVDRAIFRLLLTPLMHENEGKDYSDCRPLLKEWEDVISTLSESSYKDAMVQMPVIKSLYALISDSTFSHLEKGILIRALFALGKNLSKEEKVNLINRNLRILEAIILSGSQERLRKLIDEVTRTKLLAKDALQNCLLDIFKNILDEIENKELFEEIEKKFISGRQSLAFLTYAIKLQSLPENEKKLLQPHLNALFKNILTDKHRTERYKRSNCEHLKKLFSWKTDKAEKRAWKNCWKTGSSVPFKKLEADEKSNSEISFKAIKYLKEKICTDQHISLKDYPQIVECLNNPTASVINSNLQNLARIEQECVQKGVSESDGKIQKIRLERALIILCDDRRSDVERLKSLKDAIDIQIYSNENNQFLRDLNDLDIILKDQVVATDGWTVDDTDHWEDLLLCGTEVLGSCQNINGTPNLNKCLLNYIMDGKNRLVVLKDKEGHIQARVVIRLLWDSVLNKPVLFRERLYKNKGVLDECIDQLNAVCLTKAKALGISLVTSKGENDKADLYPNDLESLSGRAPFEYVDASHLGTTNGKFKISSKEMTLIS